jgi:hypothetical protein
MSQDYLLLCSYPVPTTSDGGHNSGPQTRCSTESRKPSPCSDQSPPPVKVTSPLCGPMPTTSQSEQDVWLKEGTPRLFAAAGVILRTLRTPSQLHSCTDINTRATLQILDMHHQSLGCDGIQRNMLLDTNLRKALLQITQLQLVQFTINQASTGIRISAVVRSHLRKACTLH